MLKIIYLYSIRFYRGL